MRRLRLGRQADRLVQGLKPVRAGTSSAGHALTLVARSFLRSATF